MLRFYGYYDRSLQVRESIIKDGSISEYDLQQAKAFELKKPAVTFLCKLYLLEKQHHSFDQQACERVFKSMPEDGECPFQLSQETQYLSKEKQ